MTTNVFFSALFAVFIFSVGTGCVILLYQFLTICVSPNLQQTIQLNNVLARPIFLTTIIKCNVKLYLFFLKQATTLRSGMVGL